MLSALAMLVAATGAVPALLLASLLLGIGYGPSPPAGSRILAATTPSGHHLAARDMTGRAMAAKGWAEMPLQHQGKDPVGAVWGASLLANPVVSTALALRGMARTRMPSSAGCP